MGDDVRDATITEGYCQSHTAGERKSPGTNPGLCSDRAQTATSKSRVWGFGDRTGAREAQRLRAAKFFPRAKVSALGSESRVLILAWMCVAFGYATLSV